MNYNVSNLKSIQYKGNKMEMSKLQDLEISRYESIYGSEMSMVADAMKEKHGYEFGEYDALAFGRLANTWESFLPMFESDTTTREQLGDILKSNLGVVVGSYSGLPIQYLASVQPINDEGGMIYYRQATATTTRGGVNAGDLLVSQTGNVNTNIGQYASEESSVTFSSGATVLDPKTVQLGKAVVKGSVVFMAGGRKFIDNGDGNIVGVGIKSEKSTINYETGELKVEFSDATGIAVNSDIDVIYVNNLVAANEVPGFRWELQSSFIRANAYMLGSSFSTLSNMVVKKKFGMNLADEVTAEAVNLVNGAILYNAINKLKISAAKNSVTLGANAISWALNGGAGVSTIDHRSTFDDVLIEATNAMYTLSGKGDVSFIITGSEGLKILKTLGLRIIKRGVAGPHLIGFYDNNIPVFYAPAPLLSNNKMLMGFRGQSWWESPLVYAPFLPVTTTSATTKSVFTQESGVVTMAGLDTVNPGFVVEVTLS